MMNFSLDLGGNYTNVTNDTDTIASCDEVVDRESLTPEIWELERVTPGDYVRLPLNILILVTGTPLNIFIIARLVYKKLHKQPTFTLLLNLAVADLATCITSITNHVIVELDGAINTLGDTDYVRCQTCKLAISFIVYNFASTFAIALISIDRFIYFKFSINYDNICSRKKVVIAVISSWVLSWILGIPPLVGIGDFVFASLCGFLFLAPSHLRKGIPYIILVLVIHSIVLVILVVTNVWVLVISCKQLHKNKIKVIGSQAKSDLETSLAKRDRAIFRKQIKLLQIFGGILGVHLVTLIPALVLIPILTFAGNVPPDLYTVTLISISSQATVHPLMESLFTPELRKLVTKCCRRGKSVKRESWMEQEL